jgi:thiamine kinase-like enzyme
MSPSSLEAIAREWVPGAGPVIIQRLDSGLVNLTCRVTRDARIYLLRIAGAEGDPGVDRSWEQRVLATAAAAGLAPFVHCFDPVRGILVADWHSGRTWTPEETREPVNVDAMAELLRRVHALPVLEPARAVSPATWVARYASELERRAISRAPGPELRGAAEARLTWLAASRPVVPVLCHSDLHRFNVLVGGRIVLLDWEYAHVSDGFWDLAGWIANNDWPAADADRLLTRYLDRTAEPGERARLRVLEWLYDYVCLLWGALYLSQRSEEESRDTCRRMILIEARLKHASGSRER